MMTSVSLFSSFESWLLRSRLCLRRRVLTSSLRESWREKSLSQPPDCCLGEGGDC